MRARLATPDDAPAIAAIYNQGIEERSATFETTLRSDEDILAWFDGRHPIVVVEDEADGVIGFARCSAYSARECYDGVFEFAVYTDFVHRRRGAGLLAMRELVTQARTAGAWKLVSRVFVDNDASRMLVAALGFRDVGVHHRHAKLDGQWRDVVVVEKFLAPLGREISLPPPPARAPREVAIASLRSDDAAVRSTALDSARSLLEVYRRSDRPVLDAVADAFFGSSPHDAGTRSRFVDLFRLYAALSREATREVDEALFSRLARLTMGADLDAFYEATFVVKQVVAHAGDASRAADLVVFRPLMLDWVRRAIDLPRAMRSRVSPGNVTSLLMTLALAGSESEEQKRELADLAVEAKERHRVEAPASMRPSQPPAPAASPDIPPAPPPPPATHGAPASASRPRRKRAAASNKKRSKRA
ncbi:MAG: N-acetyltransferase [Labilithrix sp.]|nr:N-acetyltransferase [Labilithrix sp.]